jgi:hypothetical protein
MTIISRPTTVEYRDNFDATFGKTPRCCQLGKKLGEVKPTLKTPRQIAEQLLRDLFISEQSITRDGAIELAVKTAEEVLQQQCEPSR